MPTQEDGVGQVCRASLFPGQGMVDLTVLDRLRAPRVPTVSISGDYSASLPRCEQTLASPRVENFPGRREHDAANRRVTCQPGKLRHRQCGSIVKSGRLCSGQNRNVGLQSVHRLTHTGFSTPIERSSTASGAGKALRKRHPSRAKNARHIDVVESHCARLLPRDPRRLPFLHHTRDLIWFQFFVRYFLSFIREVNLCRMPDDDASAPAARPPPAPAAHHTLRSPHRQTPRTEATRTQRTKARTVLERTHRRFIVEFFALKGPHIPGTNQEIYLAAEKRAQRPEQPWNEP